MQPSTAVKPIQSTNIEQPTVRDEELGQDPTAIRYGWVPFNNINLAGPDGTTSLYVQPHEIAGPDGRPVPNPYHRLLPKSQLIPFPTFNAITYALSDDLKDKNGFALAIQKLVASPALSNITQVLRGYSGWGFTILHALQGLEQPVAHRIFQIVQPFEYLLKDLQYELDAGAEHRINSVAPLRFELEGGEVYEIAPLQDELERDIARKLAEQMQVGADIAVTFASEIIDNTAAQMTERLGGGKGKTSPDSLDRYLQVQLGRENAFPTPVATPVRSTEALEQKLDILVNAEVSRQDREKIRMLEAEIAQLRGGDAPTIPEILKDEVEAEGEKLAVDPKTIEEFKTRAAKEDCGYIKTDGTPCKRKVDPGSYCAEHEEAERLEQQKAQ